MTEIHIALPEAPAASVESSLVRPEGNPVLLYLSSLAGGPGRGNMRSALRSILRTMGSATPPEDFPWHRLRHQDAVDLMREMQDQTPALAPKTIRVRLSALRGVLKKAWAVGLLPTDDYQRVLLVKPLRGSRLPPGRRLSAVEITKLFAVCKAPTIQNARDAAILALLRVGLRRSEVTGADLEGLDMSGGWITLIGKGDKQRAVPLPEGAVAALSRWLLYRGDAPGPLILPLSERGRVAMRRCSQDVVPSALAMLAKLAGVAPFTAHDFRRTLISDLLDQGMDLSQIREIVGHESVATTSSYDRRGIELAGKAMRRAVVPFQSLDAAPSEEDAPIENSPDTERSSP